MFWDVSDILEENWEWFFENATDSELLDAVRKGFDNAETIARRKGAYDIVTRCEKAKKLIDQLEKACDQLDADCKRMNEQHAPEIAPDAHLEEAYENANGCGLEE